MKFCKTTTYIWKAYYIPFTYNSNEWLCFSSLRWYHIQYRIKKWQSENVGCEVNSLIHIKIWIFDPIFSIAAESHTARKWWSQDLFKVDGFRVILYLLCNSYYTILNSVHNGWKLSCRGRNLPASLFTFLLQFLYHAKRGGFCWENINLREDQKSKRWRKKLWTFSQHPAWGNSFFFM